MLHKNWDFGIKITFAKHFGIVDTAHGGKDRKQLQLATYRKVHAFASDREESTRGRRRNYSNSERPSRPPSPLRYGGTAVPPLPKFKEAGSEPKLVQVQGNEHTRRYITVPNTHERRARVS
jgi:hypothetical protein